MSQPLIINGSTITGAQLLLWPFSKAEVKPKTLDLPWVDGLLDYSTAFSNGQPVYATRIVRLVVREYVATPEKQYSIRLGTWHGKILTATLPGWPDGYFQGRASLDVNEFGPNHVVYTITMTANPWYFDQTLTKVTVNPSSSGVSFGLTAPKFTVAPLVTATAAVTITIDGVPWTVPAGTADRQLPGLVIQPGEATTGQAKGSGTLTFSWRGGQLI